MGDTGKADPTGEVPGVGVQPVSYFYTGKPYDADLASYTFAYRSYDPELNRWTSSDPSGFPDGANSGKYVPSPTSQIDIRGLRAFQVFDSGVQSLTFSVGFYDSINQITQQKLDLWSSAVESAWTYTGKDISNGEPLQMNLNVRFELITGTFDLNSALSQYDNVVTFANPDRSSVTERIGEFRRNISNNSFIHEMGHFMLAPDEYHDVNDRSVPISGWENTIMGQANQRKATKLDANIVLMSLGELVHRFE